jgi:CBS domain-containing membrane protein
MLALENMQNRPNPTYPRFAQALAGAAPTWRDWLRSFLPAPVAVDSRERARVILGAFAGILLATAITRFVTGTPAMTAWILAPLGASAVLVFAAPASPLAQPWSVLGGNTISCLIGLACAFWIPAEMAAGAIAVALAIAAMFTLRCLHPPGGAMALSVVLVHSSHGHFAIGIALLNSILLIAAGLAYNTLTGRRYPHVQIHPPASGIGMGVRFKTEDLDAVLAKYNQVLDVSRDDLEALLMGAELEGYRRRMGEIRCKDVMSRNVVSVEFGSTLQEAWDAMKKYRIKALPVVDRAHRIIGIITMVDFLRNASTDGHRSFSAALRNFILPDGLVQSEKPDVVGQIMTRHTTVVGQDRHAVDLMPIFTETGHHHIPIVDEQDRMVGIITQSDFMRFLKQSNYLALEGKEES